MKPPKIELTIEPRSTGYVIIGCVPSLNLILYVQDAEGTYTEHQTEATIFSLANAKSIVKLIKKKWKSNE